MSNSLSTVEEKLPPGFRFHPRDDELICDYLMKKLFVVNSSPSEDPFTLLVEVDLNKCEPWDIPERACVGGKEWYFYSQRDRKYATGLRTNRATVSGYWKATGKDRAVVRRGSLVGMRKTLVFYQGRAPKGRKTDWVMHEFRLEGPNFSPPKLSSSKEDGVLCRVFHKSRESTPPRPALVDNYDESGCSSLPDLMDSFVSFEQTPRTNNKVNDHNNDNNNDNINQNNNNLAYEQVPCFSNQPNPNHSNSSPIFHVAQNQPTVTHAGPYHAPAYDNAQAQHDGLTFSAMPIGSVGARDRHVIKHALSHLTSNVKDATMTTSPSPVSLPGGSSSESYLSDVGFPTASMWTSHY